MVRTKVTCQICGQEISKSNIDRHIKRHQLKPETFTSNVSRKDYTCVFCNKVCKNLKSVTNHERLCKSNPNRQETTFEKYGQIKGFNDKGRKPWNKGLTKELDERVCKNGRSLRVYYQSHCGSFTGRTHTDDVKKILSKKASISNLTKFDRPSGRGKRGYYKGTYCQSSWELAYVIYCLDFSINFVRNNKYFPYEYEGTVHNYFPDFYHPDTDTYVEIKGYYDSKSSAKEIQFEGNLVVLQLEQLQPILTYVENTYGKDFWKLYDKHPDVAKSVIAPA